MLHCPRCGSPVESGQEYCLGCGGRLPGRGAPAGTRQGTSWTIRTLGALVVAAAGAALAIVASTGGAGTAEVTTATGGFATVPSTSEPLEETPSSATAGWPAGEDGWTIVLTSVPKVEGRRVAAAAAQGARRKGLRQVGVLDSSGFASLRPGYWVVFTGIYGSEAEATSALAPARRFARGASVRRIVR